MDPREHLSHEQSIAFDLAIQQHKSLFITGLAGTGKTYLLRAIVQHAPHPNSTLVTATTARAACLVDKGTTLHRAFGIDADDSKSPEDRVKTLFERCRSSCRPPRAPATRTDSRWADLATKAAFLNSDRVQHADSCRLHSIQTATLVIVDEVSMMRPTMLVAVDIIARTLRNNLTTPFGGLQMLLFGDFAQLPPVCAPERVAPFKHIDGAVDALDIGLQIAQAKAAATTTSSESSSSAAQQQTTTTTTTSIDDELDQAHVRAEPLTFIFELPLFREALQCITLSHVFRQATDEAWCQLLGRARVANCTPDDEALLRTRVVRSATEGVERCLREHGVRPTLLFPRKRDVENVNRRELHALAQQITVLKLQHSVRAYARQYRDAKERTRLLERLQQVASFAMNKGDASVFDAEVHVAKGARVMINFNVKLPTLYNGRTGTVLAVGTAARKRTRREETHEEHEEREEHAEEHEEERQEHDAVVDTSKSRVVTVTQEDLTVMRHSQTHLTAWAAANGVALVEHLVATNDTSATRSWNVLDTRSAVLMLLDPDAATPRDRAEVAILTPHKITRDLTGLGALTLHQIPIMLAWAVTVHKSQGATLQHAVVGCDAFENGQLYTALSRVPTSNAIYLSNFSRLQDCLRVHPLVAERERNSLTITNTR